MALLEAFARALSFRVRFNLAVLGLQVFEFSSKGCKYMFVLTNIYLYLIGTDRQNIFGCVLVWVALLVLCARRGCKCAYAY